MMRYYYSENLKTKHLFVRKLTVYGSIIAILLIFLLSSDFLYIHLFNWWYVIILPVIISFSCVLLSHIDGKMNDRAVRGLAVSFKNIWIAKSLVGIKYLVIACFLLFAGYILFTVVMSDARIIPIAFPNALLALFVILVTYLWQVPLFLFLGYKIGIFLSIASSLLFNTIIGPIVAAKSYWFICPFSYPGRVLCPILKIMPNGLLLESGNPSFTPALGSYTVVPIGIILSVILLIISMWVTAYWYQNEEVK